MDLFINHQFKNLLRFNFLHVKCSNIICKKHIGIKRAPLTSEQKESVNRKFKDSLGDKDEFSSQFWSGSLRNNPGKLCLPSVSLPDKYVQATETFLKSYERGDLAEVGQRLKSFLSLRRPTTYKQHSLEKLLNKKNKKTDLNDSKFTIEKFENLVDHLEEDRTSNVISKPSSNFQTDTFWKSVFYDEIISAAYLMNFSAANYASSLRVLNELKTLDPNFSPLSVLDFGSGLGSNIWASNELWSDSLKQYICVDSSNYMNNICKYMLSGGNVDSYLPGIFIRNYLPVAFGSTYDLVTASYSVSEMRLPKDRENMLRLLWKKTNKYLVLIEQGNLHGHRMLMEARNFLTRGKIGFGKSAKTMKSPIKDLGKSVAPCPHQKECPIVETAAVCKVTQKYNSPKFEPGSSNQTTTFSYLILQKSISGDENSLQWPRVITLPKKRGGNCADCMLCTPSGTAVNTQISKNRDGNHAYTLLRKARLGDLLPINNKS